MEASKVAEAQANATPAPWSPPADELDPQAAVSGAPTESSAQQRVYGKSMAYSLILPPQWEVTNQFPENDLSAQNKLLFFRVMYFKESSKTASELLDILKTRLHMDGATDFSNEFIYDIYGIRWNAFTCSIKILGDNTGSITNMINKNDKGIFILIFGSAVEAEIDTRKFFSPILDSFTIL